MHYDMFDDIMYGLPEMKSGGQHGGLDRWFAEKWVDIKTGKECGRQEGEKRKGYPACRPSKRVSSDTPKTASELSSAERAKFKREKTSSKRIDYQHRRREFGGEEMFDMDEFKSGGNVPTNPALWSKAKAAARAKYDVYPSAYANGFAAKWYKERGGGWKKAADGGEMDGPKLPSWMRVNSSIPGMVNSMIPSGDGANPFDYETGDISENVKRAVMAGKINLNANPNLGNLGQLNIRGNVSPFAEDSRFVLPDITYRNSFGNDKRNLDVEFSPEGQSFNARSNHFINGSASLDRHRTPEGFDSTANFDVRFPNNRGNISRTVAFMDPNNPYMSEMRANYRLGKTNFNASRRTEDGQNTYGAGVNTSMGPVNLNANTQFDQDNLQSYMVSGNVNLVEPSRRHPNSGTLNLSGRYGASRNQEGDMSPNYNIGLSYRNNFAEGGATGWLDKYPNDGDIPVNVERMDPANVTKKDTLMNKYKRFINRKDNSSLENLIEFVDPTGISSHDDAYQAYNQWQKSNSVLPSFGQALDMFGAVPMLGKLGKIKYLDPDALKTAYKTIPWQQILNTFDTVEDEQANTKNGFNDLVKVKKQQGGQTNWLDKYN